MEHQTWFTALLNRLLAGILSPGLTRMGIVPADPAHPISNYLAMEILVFVLLAGGALRNAEQTRR
jgi:hypothetical protein